MSLQLPLDIALRDESTLERFVVGQNDELFDLLQAINSSAEQKMLLITGLSGSGKTHLLQAVCRRSPRTMYLPLQALPKLTPEIFEGLDAYPLICLDDLQLVAGQSEMELALFSLINDIRDSGRSFIFSSQLQIDSSGFKLQDLVSRLSACTHYHLEVPEDSHKIEFLQADADRRGLQISHDVINWILTHTPRDMVNLVALMKQLDHESLRAQRKITIPFIKQVLRQGDK